MKQRSEVSINLENRYILYRLYKLYIIYKLYYIDILAALK